MSLRQRRPSGSFGFAAGACADDMPERSDSLVRFQRVRGAIMGALATSERRQSTHGKVPWRLRDRWLPGGDRSKWVAQITPDLFECINPSLFGDNVCPHSGRLSLTDFPRHILTHSPARSFVYPKAPTRLASGHHATITQHHCAQNQPPPSELAIPPAAEMHCCAIESMWGFLCLAEET